jgi:hypothetical protein
MVPLKLADIPLLLHQARLKIYNQENYRVFASRRQQDKSSLTIPAGTLISGQTYIWRVEASDSSAWLETNNVSNNEYQTFHVLYIMPCINSLLLND